MNDYHGIGGAYRYDPATDRLIPETAPEPIAEQAEAAPVEPEPTERKPK